MLANAVMLLHADGKQSCLLRNHKKAERNRERFCIVRLVPAELFIRKTGGIFLVLLHL